MTALPREARGRKDEGIKSVVSGNGGGGWRYWVVMGDEIDDFLEGVIDEHENKKEIDVEVQDLVDILLEVQIDNSTGNQIVGLEGGAGSSNPKGKAPRSLAGREGELDPRARPNCFLPYLLYITHTALTKISSRTNQPIWI
ncbi:hypothetical protein L1987_85194 [Smallanthus sonchifolius]|uniref:Uncharacterized protein n=1 Tax=Smallanthus sonchifolius TaxID=185202 RepID=A0ACB8XXF8_9ASTR|nr:hypothetical protein L1987_85194 [Smallanthus sonchifolius]